MVFITMVFITMVFFYRGGLEVSPQTPKPPLAVCRAPPPTDTMVS